MSQHKTCSNCSADLACGSEGENCWCMGYAPVTVIEGKDCLCEACLKEELEETKKKNQHGDYYIENGFYVFTAKYHLKRGSCCKNGCRHCPYGVEK